MKTIPAHAEISGCHFPISRRGFIKTGSLVAGVSVLGFLPTSGLLAKDQALVAASPGVQISQLADRLRVEINGKLFTEYYFKDVPRPFAYPINGPDGLMMTRHWPMKNEPDEEHDHAHHRSLWFAHGDVNGQDFWTETPGAGKILHAGFDEIKSGQDYGLIKARDNWVAADGRVICTSEQTLRIYQRPDDERLFDFETTLHASHGDLVLGDTKEGTMAIRLAETMRLMKPAQNKSGKPRPGDGHAVNSEGLRDEAAWGKRAAWVDYYGPVAGKIVGVAIFDCPQNPHHPTWWHVRDYGLFAANPFGQHDFEGLKQNPTAGNLMVPAGKSVTFRYRFYLHEGNERQAKVTEHFEEYIRAGFPAK